VLFYIYQAFRVFLLGKKWDTLVFFYLSFFNPLWVSQKVSPRDTFCDIKKLSNLNERLCIFPSFSLRIEELEQKLPSVFFIQGSLKIKQISTVSHKFYSTT
jgi:hypothetical protein